jgi:hypothetical protein
LFLRRDEKMNTVQEREPEVFKPNAEIFSPEKIFARGYMPNSFDLLFMKQQVQRIGTPERKAIGLNGKTGHLTYESLTSRPTYYRRPY